MKVKPNSKKQNIVVQEIEKDLLVYDLQINKAFVLNETSALVFQLCDGKRTVAEISQILNRKSKQFISEDLIWLALDNLKKENLLEDSQRIEIDFKGLTRRQVIRKVGLSSMIVLPLVSSIIAPHAVQSASSCLQPNILFCSSAPQPDFNACLTYLQNNLRPICCSGASGFTDFNPANGSCCGQCDGV